MLAKLRAWFKRYREYRSSLGEKAVIVDIDEERISAAYPDGQVASVRWQDVRTIAIETNNSGPWGYDVWWLIEGELERCIYPNGATGYDRALDELERRFIGFSDDTVIKAMGCTSNKRFVCWDHSNAP